MQNNQLFCVWANNRSELCLAKTKITIIWSNSLFSDEWQTFRPKKKFEPGTLRYSLHKQAIASLNSGINLREVVQLPPGECHHCHHCYYSTTRDTKPLGFQSKNRMLEIETSKTGVTKKKFCSSIWQTNYRRFCFKTFNSGNDLQKNSCMTWRVMTVTPASASEWRPPHNHWPQPLMRTENAV